MSQNRIAVLLLWSVWLYVGCQKQPPQQQSPTADASVPGPSVPGPSVPGPTVPGPTVPSATAPSATAPSATVPSASVPGVQSEATIGVPARFVHDAIGRFTKEFNLKLDSDQFDGTKGEAKLTVATDLTAVLSYSESKTGETKIRVQSNGKESRIAAKQIIDAVLADAQKLATAPPRNPLNHDLNQFKNAYFAYEQQHKKGPANWEEITIFAKSIEIPTESIQKVKDAGYLVRWGVSIPRNPAPDDVMAHRPSGGPKVMFNGRIVE